MARQLLHRVGDDAQVEDLVASLGDLGIVGGQHQGAAAFDCLEDPGEGRPEYGTGSRLAGRPAAERAEGFTCRAILRRRE